MNDRLAALNFNTPAAATYWRETYLPRWTFWNYLRAVAAGGTAICFLIACILLA